MVQTFNVRAGILISRFLWDFRIVVASSVEKGGPLAASPDMAIKLLRIRAAPQYPPMLMPTLLPGELMAIECPYD